MRGYSVSVSMLVHGAVVSVVVLVSFLGPTDLPTLAQGTRVFILPPPAAAAPPPPKGTSGTRRPKVRPDAVRVEPEATPGAVPAEIPVEPDLAHGQPAGDPAGSERGEPHGITGGVDGGIKGGVPWGVVGGCPDCTGDGPVADWDQGPRLLRQTPPVYPQEAFVKKIQGVVLLEILIDAQGNVVATRLLRSVSPALDEAAAQAVRQWKFTPAFRRGRAVAMWAQAPVQFIIR